MCPYCREPIEIGSKDHIFPAFLGGHRRIPACKSCNDLFGHTFEAVFANMLRQFYISMRSWGLPIPDLPMMKAIHMDSQGRQVDLVFTPDGPTPRLSRPEINRDEAGDIVSGVVRDAKEAQRIHDAIAKSGKFKEVIIEEHPLDVDFGTLQTVTTYGAELGRTALKMCIALASLMPNFDAREIAGATALLRDMNTNLGTRASLDLRIHDGLDTLAIPLAHLIYVEYGREGMYGIVQFFGYHQMFCALTRVKTTPPRAMLGTLDSLTGSEKFEEVVPLAISVPRIMFREEEMTKGFVARVERLQRAATARGAKSVPILRHERFVASTLPIFALVSGTAEMTIFVDWASTLDRFIKKA